MSPRLVRLLHHRLRGDARALAPADWRTRTPEVVRSHPDAQADHVTKAHVKHLPRFWQVRYYDFPVWSEAKRIEKLRYIHRNPVERGLVERLEDWKWSSFVHYATGREGIVEIESQWTARGREQMGVVLLARAHPPAKSAGRVGQPSES